MLVVCCEYLGYFKDIMGVCWGYLKGILVVCWRFVGGMLWVCCRYVVVLLRVCWWYVVGMLVFKNMLWLCWIYIEVMLVACILDMLMVCWGIWSAKNTKNTNSVKCESRWLYVGAGGWMVDRWLHSGTVCIGNKPTDREEEHTSTVDSIKYTRRNLCHQGHVRKSFLLF